MKTTRYICIMLLAALLAGCAPCKRLTTESRDSLRVEIRERIVYRDTTVYKAIPADSQAQTVRDTTSHLENDFAVSDARITPDGALFHSLETKPQLFGVHIRMPERRRDSIVYRNIYRVDTVEVPRALTWWQHAKMKGFWIMLTVLLIMLLRKHISKYIRVLFK